MSLSANSTEGRSVLTEHLPVETGTTPVGGVLAFC